MRRAEWTVCSEDGCHERVQIPEDAPDSPLAALLDLKCWKHTEEPTDDPT